MKKILLTLALAAFAMTANAQLVIGGNIGFNHNGNSAGDYSTTATTSFSFMPKVGYWLNDQMQVGAQLGCNYNYRRVYDGDNNNDHYSSQTQMSWNFAPYFRYNLTSWKNFTVFAEAQVALGITPKASLKNNTTGTTADGNVKSFDLGVNIVPGLNYALTDNISFDLYINLAGVFYNFNKTTTTVAGTDNVTRNHNYGFMADMNAQTLTAHLNNFMIGFNYAF